MQTFDILDPEAALFGAKVLQASAGTGKTFAIEHLIVRLLLESDIEIEGILAITYTRAAAREMRMRIRSNIKQALDALRRGSEAWPYLKRHLGSKEKVRRLEGALSGFEGAQIFTIHGFCQRMLAEFSLEARCLQPEGEETAPLGKALRPDLLDFLETQEALGPEQMQELLKKKKEFLRLAKDLLNQPQKEEAGCFRNDCRTIEELLRSSPFLGADVAREFSSIESGCKTTGFPRSAIAEQLDALAELISDPSSEQAMRRLLRWKGDLFRFVSLTNRKKGKEALGMPPLFEWCITHLHPLIEEMMDPKRLFQRLRFAWQKPFEELLEERGLFSPDFLLEKMRRSLAYPEFLSRIRNRYQAVIIDEFQDTDALQWEIFSTLFQKKPFFYLVGDPKQSIYRFRNADLYTYYRACESFGPDAVYSLDTNYRSQPKLVHALNDLFDERHAHPWLTLPGENRDIPYRPVKAGVRGSWDPDDGAGFLQFFKVDNLKEDAYAYIADEILRLQPTLPGFSSFAVLVQSNAQAQRVQEYLQSRLLPCAAKSRSSLGDSLAMQTLFNLFDALFFPRDAGSVKLFLAGPLIAKPFEETSDLPHLFSWKNTLDRKGMAAFFREFLASRWDGEKSFYEKIAGCGAAFFRDFFQLAETLIAKEPQSYEAIVRIFREIEEADPEEDAKARRRMDESEDAVQILTMHTSKGLEFDVVFALGAATPTPVQTEDLEEVQAEKLRQLYVALTRAKKRLYIPLTPIKPKKGGEPPLELFWEKSKLGKEGVGIVEKLIEINPHIRLGGRGSAPLIRPLGAKARSSVPPPEPFSFPKPPGAIYSYSSLVQQKIGDPLAPLEGGKTIHTLPRGAEVGTLFHRIFERIFMEQKSASEIVEEEMRLLDLSGWEEVVLQTVKGALSLPFLEGASLLDLDRTKMRAEVEFFFHARPHFFKGCIDLLFLWKERLYFLDWKTNWLGPGFDSYSEENLRRAMDEHNYWMQASLYAEAIRRSQPDIAFGGAAYLFLRGGSVLSFEPEPFRAPR